VTVVFGSAIIILFLTLVNLVPFILVFPAYLLPISLYLVIMSIKEVDERRITHTYYLVWSAVALTISVGWITFYFFQNPLMTVIEVLLIFLGYYYINRLLSTNLKIK